MLQVWENGFESQLLNSVGVHDGTIEPADLRFWRILRCRFIARALLENLPNQKPISLLQLIESTPALSGIGVLWDPTTGSLQLAAVETAARGMGIDLQIFEARRAADIADAFYAVDLAHIQGVLVLSSPLFGGNPQLVADVAVRRNVPTISLFPDIAREGGLLAYGPDIQGLYRQAGAMVRKVLQGAKPAELPAERPTRFQLIANLKTAKTLGLELPSTLVARADEVIE